MKRCSLALFIGRFQPFHKGHLYSLKKALALGEEVIVGIGSSNVNDKNNPWGYETRKRMVEAVVKKNGWGDRVRAIWAVPDDPSDEAWGKMIVDSLFEEGAMLSEVVAVGNNDWTNRLLKARGIAVRETGLFNRDELEGVKIRAMIVAGDEKWKERVSDEVVELVES